MLAGLAHGDGVQKLDQINVFGHYETAVGTSDAASSGYITPQLIDDRPLQRPGEVLEYVPGMIVTQHSGAGKANQYFLRGFNLDHGTDFATYLAGMPVNLRTLAHGQSYMDLNFMIPELVSRIDYYKGPYFAQQGDFATAGSANIHYAESLPNTLAELGIGTEKYGRVQFNQYDNRKILGWNGSWTRPDRFFGLEMTHTLGWDIRQDRLDPVAIYNTIQRQRLSTRREDRIRETSYAIYAENQTHWTDWLRTIAGIRGDRYDFKVDSNIAENSGSRSAAIGSAKLSVVLGPWQKTEYFVNFGEGFHSNDGRGTTTHVDPSTGEAVDRSGDAAGACERHGVGCSYRGHSESAVFAELVVSPSRFRAGLPRRHRNRHCRAPFQTHRHRMVEPLHAEHMAAGRSGPRLHTRPLCRQ